MWRVVAAGQLQRQGDEEAQCSHDSDGFDKPSREATSPSMAALATTYEVTNSIILISKGILTIVTLQIQF